jgi:hypothetical protein
LPGCQQDHLGTSGPATPECPVYQAQACNASSPNPISNPTPTPDAPFHQVFIKVHPISRLYTDDTGRFPVKARSGNQYVMIAYHADGNLIFQQAFKTRNDRHCIAAYNAIMA